MATETLGGALLSQPLQEAEDAAGTDLDEAAFAAFYARASAPLWRYLRRLSGDGELASDLVQESFVKLLLHPSHARDERRRRAYLFRIGTNLLRDRWRREKVETGFLEGLLSAWTPGAHRPRSGLKSDLDAVLGQLKPRERALLWLAYVEEYNHQEIAGILDLKTASVKVMLFRARRRLAKLLASHGLGKEDETR